MGKEWSLCANRRMQPLHPACRNLLIKRFDNAKLADAELVNSWEGCRVSLAKLAEREINSFPADIAELDYLRSRDVGCTA